MSRNLDKCIAVFNKNKARLRKTKRNHGGKSLITNSDPSSTTDTYYLGLDWVFTELAHDDIIVDKTLTSLLKHTSPSKDMTDVLMGTNKGLDLLKERNFYSKEYSFMKYNEKLPYPDAENYRYKFSDYPNDTSDKKFKKNYFRYELNTCTDNNVPEFEKAPIYIGCYNKINQINTSSRFILDNGGVEKPPRMKVDFMTKPLSYDKSTSKKKNDWITEDILININNVGNTLDPPIKTKNGEWVKHVFITLDASVEPIRAVLQSEDDQFPDASSRGYIWIVNLILSPAMYADPATTGNNAHIYNNGCFQKKENSWCTPDNEPRSKFVVLRVFKDYETFVYEPDDPVMMYADSITYIPDLVDKGVITTKVNVSSSGIFDHWTKNNGPTYVYNMDNIHKNISSYIDKYASKKLNNTGFQRPITIEYNNFESKTNEKFFNVNKPNIQTQETYIIGDDFDRGRSSSFLETSSKNMMFISQHKRWGDHGQIAYNRRIGKTISDANGTPNQFHYEWGKFTPNVSHFCAKQNQIADRTIRDASLREMLIKEGVPAHDMSVYISSRFSHTSGDYPAFGYSIYHGMTSIVINNKLKLATIGVVNASVRSYI